MRVPLVDLRAEYLRHRDEVLAAVEAVLDGMELYLGPQVRALEEEFAALCDVPYAVGVGSGTEALLLSYLALGLGAGDEVIVPSHTFIGTVAPLVFAGARPVFVDIEPATYTLDHEAVRRAITSHTRAVVPVHLYGHPADLRPLLALAGEFGLDVVEDACQAAGALYEGRRVGSVGALGCFSFVFTKNLRAYGDAGMVVTADARLAESVRRLRDHGRVDKYRHAVFGLNCRLDEIQAAIVRIHLRHLEAKTAGRRAIAARYDEALAGAGLAQPVEAAWARHVYHQYVVRSPERDGLASWLAGRGVASGVHYPIPCHLQPACAAYGYRPGSLPVTEASARQVLSLPVYPEMTREQVDYVIEAVLSWPPARRRARATSREEAPLRALS